MTLTPISPGSSDQPGTPPQPRLLTCRQPEDVLAAIPVVLGFDPAESVVMLTAGGRESFHGRVDLPRADEPATYDEVRDLLRDPALAHRSAAVMLVVYGEDTPLEVVSLG